MDGLTNNGRIKATSLMETIIAMVVIMIVFGIGITIYATILRNSFSLAELVASQKLEQLSKDTREQKTYFDESFQEGEIKVEKKVSYYNQEGDVLLLELEAKDETRTLSHWKELIVE